MEFHGIFSIDFHGIPWKRLMVRHFFFFLHLMEIHGKMVPILHGIPWKIFHGIPFTISMDFHGIQWKI